MWFPYLKSFLTAPHHWTGEVQALGAVFTALGDLAPLPFQLPFPLLPQPTLKQPCVWHAFVQSAAFPGNSLFLNHLSKILAPGKILDVPPPPSSSGPPSRLPCPLARHCPPVETELPEGSRVILSYSSLPYYLNAVPSSLNINWGNE